MTYVGFGSCQFVLSPPLGDSQSTVGNLIIDSASSTFEEIHDVRDTHCLDLQDANQDRIAVVQVVGENSIIRDLTVSLGSTTFQIGNSRNISSKCFTSHHLDNSSNFILGCKTDSDEYSMYSILTAGSPISPNVISQYNNRPLKFGVPLSQKTKHVKSMTKIPATGGQIQSYNFAYVNKDNDIYFCGSELLSSDTCTQIAFTDDSQPGIIVKFDAIDFI